MEAHTNDTMRVLVATDGSLAARAGEHWVTNIGWASPPSIEVLTVARGSFSPAWTGGTDDAVAKSVAALAEREADLAQRNADTVAARLRDHGLQAEAVTCSGEPGVEILQAIDERRPALAVLGSRGRSELEGALLGSVSQQVVRHANVPILVGRPAGMPPGHLPQRVLVLAPTEPAARSAIGWLKSTGWLSGARVTLLGLLGLPSGLAAPDPAPAGRASAELEERCRAALGAHVQGLETMCAAVRLEVGPGHPLRESLDLADALGVDLVVVPGGPVHRGQYPLAEKVTRYAKRSVLVIPIA